MHETTPHRVSTAPQSLDLSRDGAAVWASGLTRSFVSGRGRSAKTVHALSGVDLGIGRGELFGVLGPERSKRAISERLAERVRAPIPCARALHRMELRKRGSEFLGHRYDLIRLGLHTSGLSFAF